MPELVMPGGGNADRSVREAVCVHTKRIMDSCRDKDCLENLRVYPTRTSQEILDRAMSVKAGCAQLVYAYIDVEPVNFNQGYYAVDIRYYYRITADAFVGGGRPVEVYGLAFFDKRVILYGGEEGAKTFTSEMPCRCVNTVSSPEAVLEAVDPLILGMKLMDACDCRTGEYGSGEIPEGVAACFGEPLMAGGDAHRLFVTLGQFSIIRLERDAQLLMPVYDYCMPEKDCSCGAAGRPPRVEDPCELFEKVPFPVGKFVPSGSAPERGENTFNCGC